MKQDFHMHTSFSSDSQADPEEMIESAINKGLTGICFTDHQDWDMPGATPDMSFTFDTEAYFEKMTALRERYKDKIDINIGVELGLQEHLAEKYTEFTSKYPFDLIIGSIHAVNGKDPYYKEYFEGRSDHEAFMEYFECTYENIKAFKGFDVCGHIDYALRYTPTSGYVLDYKEFGDILDAILKEIVDSGLGIELNTAGLRFNMGHPNPHEDVIKRYREFGGDIITIGADAHTPESVGYAFHQVKDILTECGFEYYCIFHGRQPVYIRL